MRLVLTKEQHAQTHHRPRPRHAAGFDQQHHRRRTREDRGTDARLDPLVARACYGVIPEPAPATVFLSTCSPPWPVAMKIADRACWLTPSPTSSEPVLRAAPHRPPSTWHRLHSQVQCFPDLARSDVRCVRGATDGRVASRINSALHQEPDRLVAPISLLSVQFSL